MRVNYIKESRSNFLHALSMVSQDQLFYVGVCLLTGMPIVYLAATIDILDMYEKLLFVGGAFMITMLHSVIHLWECIKLTG